MIELYYLHINLFFRKIANCSIDFTHVYFLYMYVFNKLNDNK